MSTIEPRGPVKAGITVSLDGYVTEGFDRDVDLKVLSVHHSPYAVHVRYAVVR